MTENFTISTIKKSIVVFVLLTFALSCIPWFLIMTIGVEIMISEMAIYTTYLLIWSPGIAAIITALIFFRSIKGFGWRPGKIKYLAMAFSLPIGVNLISYGLFWLFGLGTYTGNWSDIILGVLIGVNSLILALGEEIGWRGFLVPQLAKITTFIWVAVISGAIWSLWHFPLMIMGTYLAETPLWWSLPIFFLGGLLLSVVYAWLTIKSGSLWPAVFYHGIDNSILIRFSPLAGGDLSTYYVGEAGIITLMVLFIFAFIFWKYRNRLPDLRISKSDKPVNNT